MQALFTLVRRSVQEFGNHHCSHLAAAVSYYVLFSLFPLLIFLVSIFSFVLERESIKEQVIEGILGATPLSRNDGTNLIREAIDAVVDARGALSVLGVIGVAWSASSMFAVLRTALNIAWDVERKRPLVLQKLMDLAMVVGVGLLFLLSLGTTMALQVARRLSDQLPLGEVTGFSWEVAFVALPALFSFLTFSLIFRFVPNVRVRWSEAFLGAAVTMVLFELGKNGFAFYVRNFANYDATYGAIGGVIAFLFWTYLSAAFVLFGAEVASEFPRVMRGDYRQPEPTTAPKGGLRQRALRTAKGFFVHMDEEAQ